MYFNVLSSESYCFSLFFLCTPIYAIDMGRNPEKKAFQVQIDFALDAELDHIAKLEKRSKSAQAVYFIEASVKRYLEEVRRKESDKQVAM